MTVRLNMNSRLMCVEHACLSNPAAYVHVKQWAALWQQASASYCTTFA